MLEDGCDCATCDGGRGLTRAYLHSVVKESAACHAITVHNVAFQLRLMRDVREAVTRDEFPQFVKKFFAERFPDKKDYPEWAVNALKAVNVDLK